MQRVCNFMGFMSFSISKVMSRPCPLALKAVLDVKRANVRKAVSAYLNTCIGRPGCKIFACQVIAPKPLY